MSADPPAIPDHDANLSDLGRALFDTGGSKPSGRWEPPTAEELHQILPQYEIVKMLGRGGMGAVYMGTQTALDRPVAIKILSATLEESDAGFTERFKNEARAMAKLNHPGIVSVYDFGEAPGGLLYIVMEYVDGTDVARMIAHKGRLHTDHAMAITAHVCDALTYAHERGIIHRDIKPANIMVSHEGVVKVADFGLAKMSHSGESGLTQSGMAMGTLHYMAPEALMLGTAVDQRADIYAAGVMLYQMLTGKLPQGLFKMPSLSVPGLDPRYDGIIAKAMMEDREARYQNARGLRADLDSILTQPVVKADPAAAQASLSALPMTARPQRPGSPAVRQPFRPPQPRMAVQPQKRGSLMYWVIVLALAAASGWMLLDRAKNTEMAAAETPPGPSTPGVPTKADLTDAPVATAGPQPPAPSAIPASTPAPPQPSFTNSLGMKFIQVPEIEVQFCVHETRRKDYAAYAGAVPGVNTQWQNPVFEGVPLETGENHPVTQVSWDEAKAFCAWLGQKEGRKYRLPTDREWSVAVGLGAIEPPDLKVEDALTSATQDVYPWGIAWPPPPGSGNFADLAYNKLFPQKRFLKGYSDGFATTAPVMSFKPDARGIYDMAGNVHELCDDITGWSKNHRCRRGGSFNDYYEFPLVSARRQQTYPGSRYELTGFRCVLEEAAGTAAASSAAPAMPPPAPVVAPAPPATTTATPTLWIDSKGRSLQATFVKMDGSSVVLNIAGKDTPVPLSTLSAASQQIAASQTFQARLADESWLPGSWLLTGAETSSTPVTLDFLPHHLVIQTRSSRSDMGGWKLAGDVLTITWQRGRTQTVKLHQGLDLKSLSGSTAENDSPASACSLTKTADLLTVDAPAAKDLEGLRFRFAWRNSTTPDRSKFESDRSLLAKGRIDSTDRAYVTWEMKGGKLVARNGRGQDETIFDKFFKLGGRWIIEGNFLYWKGEITHVLMQQ